MMNGKEHYIIKACNANLMSEAVEKEKKNERIPVSGLMMELFEFTTNINDNNQAPKEGRIFRLTSMDQVEFIKGLQNKSGHIQMRDKRRKKGVNAKFWAVERAKLDEMKEMIDESFMFKHSSILRPICCADSDEVSKVIVACENFDCTLQDWLRTEGPNSIPPGDDYLSDQGKEIVRAGLTAIEHLWSIGYTCDRLDMLDTYVMAGNALKILPFFVRKRSPTENDDTGKLALTAKFADLLDKIFVDTIWHDPEIRELTGLMRNKHASFELILGHPVLASPEERQLMYRLAYFPDTMTQDQLSALEAHASVDSQWIPDAMQLDTAFNDILKGTFTNDVKGALQFAIVASCHYSQRMKTADPTWNGQMSSDHVDNLLKKALPLLLCKRYALKVHDAFRSKAQFQL